MKRLFHLLLLLVLAAGEASASEFLPAVVSYTNGAYRAAAQNWSVSTGTDGMIYAGNNQGVLFFDGYTWGLYPIPGNKQVRAVLSVGDRLYVGGYREFGFFCSDKTGTPVYTSLSDTLDDFPLDNQEIWRILDIDGRIVFQSFGAWFILEKDDTVKAFKSPSFIHFFNDSREGVWTHSVDSGVCRIGLDDGKLDPIPGVPFKSWLISVLDLEEGVLAVTYSDGLFLYDGTAFTPFHTEADAQLASLQVNNALLDMDGNILVGTRLGGVFCIRADGHLLWHLDASNQLPGNTVLGMSLDPSSNLWLALDNGLAVAMLGSRMREAGFPGIGDVYCAAYEPPYLYLGTSQGLYRGLFSEDEGSLGPMAQVAGEDGYVMALSHQDGQLFAGTGGVTYEIQDGRVVEACPVAGGSAMDRGWIHGREVLLQGTFTHLCVYLKDRGRWRFSHTVEGFVEPVQSLKIDFRGTVWAGHQHSGVYAVTLSDDLTRVDTAVCHLLPEGEGCVSVYSYKGRVVFSNDGPHHYTWDDLKGELVPFPEADGVVFSGDVAVPEDAPVWLMNGFEARPFPRILPMPDSSMLFLLNNAVAHYDPEGDLPVPVPALVPGEIRVYDRSVSGSDGILLPWDASPRLPWRQNSIRFSLRCPGSLLFPVRFQTLLEGFDSDWQDVSGKPEAVYGYLPHGQYKFRIRSLDVRTQQPLSEWDYSFVVRPPFYLSVWAWMLYILLACLLVWSIYQRGEAERGRKEVKRKSKELSATTMNIIRKNEILIRIREELTAQKTRLGKDYPDKDYRKICQMIDSHLSSEDDWAVFEKNFDRIHENFFSSLRHRYPSLTDNDLRVCAYLHLNLSTKDIASLMNISAKGVEAARSRIRKKIQLPSEQSLTAFMMELK